MRTGGLFSSPAGQGVCRMYELASDRLPDLTALVAPLEEAKLLVLPVALTVFTIRVVTGPERSQPLDLILMEAECLQISNRRWGLRCHLHDAPLSLAERLSCARTDLIPL